MLRGFRWQLVAFAAAALMFIAALSSRTQTEPPVSNPATTPQPTVSAAPTFTPNPGILIQPEISDAALTTFREGLVGAVYRLNPLLANAAEADITALIYEGLTATNSYGEPVPLLARSWVISSDGLEYIITLRDDVLWQDGVPFTAADVAFTMSLLRAPDFPGDARLGTFWRTVETDILGDYLIRFRLTQPLGSFLDKLRVGILPQHALAGTTAAQLAGHPFSLSPIGTGPYQLEALRTDNGGRIRQIDLRAAPVYQVRSANHLIDRLSFKIYPVFDEALTAVRNAEIDGLAARSHREREPLLAAANLSRYDTHTALEAALGVLIFNWQRDETRFFREQRVRLALETGMDRTSTIERRLINRAVRADSPLWPGSWAYASDLRWPPHDLNTARFLLETANLHIPQPENAESSEAEATQEPTSSPYLFSFSILVPDDPALVGTLQEFAAQWSQLNVNVTIEPENLQTYQRRLDTGDFDAALVEMSLGDSADPDVYAFWHQGQYPDGLNYGGMDDSGISELLERARRDPSGINRDMLYDTFQREFVERAIAIPMYYPLFTYVTASDVQGVQLGFIGSPSDRFRTILNWSRLAG